jgi:hypothetical protein
VLLGTTGCNSVRTENPRVGGSIPPLATTQISVFDPFHSNLLTGEGLAEVDLQRLNADPATACGGTGAVVERLPESGKRS